jgi:hypothetical protein
MSKILNNKKLKISILIFVLLSIASQVSKGSGEKECKNKLELIRDFILANYPVNLEHSIKIETITGLKEGFWEFSVIVGELDSLVPPEMRSPGPSPTTRNILQESGVYSLFPPEIIGQLIDEKGKITGGNEAKFDYKFSFEVSESLEILRMFAKGPKIEEKLIIIEGILKREKELTLDNIENLLNNMVALYPIDLKSIDKITKTENAIVVRFKEEFVKKIKKDILSRKNLWKFLGKERPIIKDVCFFLINMGTQIFIRWNVSVRIGKTEYSINFEPFYGYICEIDLETI